MIWISQSGFVGRWQTNTIIKKKTFKIAILLNNSTIFKTRLPFSLLHRVPRCRWTNRFCGRTAGSTWRRPWTRRPTCTARTSPSRSTSRTIAGRWCEKFGWVPAVVIQLFRWVRWELHIFRTVWGKGRFRLKMHGIANHTKRDQKLLG